MQSAVTEMLGDWLLENPNQAQAVIAKVIGAAGSRAAARELVRVKAHSIRRLCQEVGGCQEKIRPLRTTRGG